MQKVFVTLMLSLLLSSCGVTLFDSMQVYQLHPAQVSLPKDLRKVAVIDRLHQKEGDLPRNTLNFESAAYAEQLAKVLAQADFFDDVVVCDSNIAHLDRNDSLMFPLRQEYVQDLADDLGVDVLVAVEGVQVKTLWNVQPMAQIASLVRLYIPGRSSALCNVLLNDTVVWDEEIAEIPLRELRRDVMEFTAEKMGQRLTPYWHLDNRYYFIGSSMALRDGALMAGKGDWETAYAIWYEAAQAAKGVQKLQLSYNLILAKEMMGDIAQAQTDCETLLAQCEKYPELATALRLYSRVLADRVRQLQILDLQMDRFM